MQRVICLGSPQGADALAWRLGDALEARIAQSPASTGVEIVRCASPAHLPGLLGGLQAVLILDAVAQLPAGTARVLAPEEIEDAPAWSSHGMGLVTALELARALGDHPPQVTILGLGTGSPDADVEALTAVLFPAVLRVLAEQASTSPPPGRPSRTGPA